ncbi:DUF4159 domain-containing protein [Roseibium aestuarii]|uniref:DUF4159 domain-containing protein n=1 Tax=Roseibium aestuarii TaxID=2600299 RepID=A0ABW4K1B1_9HYPH|nr:DUF4159 domain-containing protein [Roseibium aestuarii]
MIGSLPLAFASPWMLLALASLPAIWWLLRLTPPRPQEITFPPLRLLLDIFRHEEMPSRSPWWLTLLRLCLAALVILALAGPIWQPTRGLPDDGDGPVLLVLDNGWTSAGAWDRQVALADTLLAEAERSGRTVMLGATADGPAQALEPTSAAEAREHLRALQPRPWAPERDDLIAGLREATTRQRPGAVVWLSDGTDHAVRSAGPAAEAADAAGASPDRDPGTGFARALADLASPVPLRIYTGLDVPLGLKGLANNAEALTVTVLRHPDTARQTAQIRALDLKGLVLAEHAITFADGSSETVAAFDLPSELRNDIARVEIAQERAAGAVQLVDDSWRRRMVGLVSGQSGDQDQPLLSPLYYLQRALSPFSDLRLPRAGDMDQAIPELLDQGIAVLVLADVGRLPEPVVERLDQWVRNGGTLLRFAGPRTAGGTDALIPVTLRNGDRTLGGALSWKQPQHLAPFAPESPFAGIAVPPEVTVSRQVLAEPSPTLSERTWAMLEDGTPLVTARAVGRGSLVLFHVTADSAWSNLPLSGSFVDMLRRVLSVSNAFAAADSARSADATDASAATTEEANVLPPLRLLDGQGAFTTPPADIAPILADRFAATRATRSTPPGLYGSEDGFRALNLLSPDASLTRLDLEPLGARVEGLAYPSQESTDLRTLAFLLAFALILLDGLAVILLGGGVSRLTRRLRRPGRIASVALALALAGTALIPHGDALAQETSDDLRALEASLKTRLAYVRTGSPELDDISDAGLFGLSQYLADRTALEPGLPMGVDLARDELAFFSLLYWPVDPALAKPDAATMSRVDTFMRNGGTILFDTRDHLASSTSLGASPATLKLREILDGLDIPALEPVPTDHVLTKSFYLLDSFPGRYGTSPLWVESLEGAAEGRPVRGGDGVSPILITGNDMAAAWAMDREGRPLLPTVPDDPLQREYAYRAGINIVMYTLTGNYKADQVHIPDLLERLGQ